MKRLLPGRVYQAYKRKGLKAVVGSWRTVASNEVCGCPIMVTFNTRKEIIDGKTKEGRALAATALDRARQRGFKNHYINAFIAGFDGSPNLFGYNESGRQGYEDGLATFLHLKNKGLIARLIARIV